MKFLPVLALLFAGALAIPTECGSYDCDGGNEVGNGGGNGGFFKPCTEVLYAQAQCCDTNVLDVLNLDCANPTASFGSVSAFKSLCAKSGKAPACCTLPILGQGVLCKKPRGI